MGHCTVTDSEIEGIQGRLEACDGLKDFEAAALEEWTNKVINRVLSEVKKNQQAQIDKLYSELGDSLKQRQALAESEQRLRDDVARLARESLDRPTVSWNPTDAQISELLAFLGVRDTAAALGTVREWFEDAQEGIHAPAQPAEPDASKVTRLWIALDDDDYRELQAEADKRLAEGRELPEGHSCEIGGIIGEIVRDLNEYRDLYEAGMSKATENLPYKPADQPATAEAGTGEEVPLPEGHTEVEGYPLLCEDGGGYVLSRESHNDQRLIAYSFLTSQHLERMRSGKYKPATVRQVAEFMIRNLAAAANLAVTFTPTP